jgi:hypothetical protein
MAKAGDKPTQGKGRLKLDFGLGLDRFLRPLRLDPSFFESLKRREHLERLLLKSLELRPPASPRKRHAPKSGPAIAVLKHLYPPDGRPSRQAVSDSALQRAYHAECNRRDIHKNDRVGKSQLLRCVGRKK